MPKNIYNEHIFFIYFSYTHTNIFIKQMFLPPPSLLLFTFGGVLSSHPGT